MNFVDMIMYYGHSNPEKQAIILVDRVVSYRMLASGIRSVETAVVEAGLDKRHIVAIRVDSQTRHLIVVSALYRLGIVSVSVTDHMDVAKAGVKVDALISDKNQPLPNMGRLIVLGDDWFQRPPNVARTGGFASDDALARIVMSSGTTAAPKAIGMSGRVVEDRIVTGRRTLALAPWDRMMCLPVLTSSLGFGSPR
jgi:acyl-coenzyme A synthetase/AMP-(fatty) acid ligase